MGLIMGPNITCRALVLKTADPVQSMYIGNLSKQMWALITYIGPGPEVLSSDRPTIYNHADWREEKLARRIQQQDNFFLLILSSGSMKKQHSSVYMSSV